MDETTLVKSADSSYAWIRKNTKSSLGKISTFAMQAAEQDLVTRSGENLLGILRKLQCT